MISQSFIQADWTLALWAFLVGITAFGFWAETTKFGRNLSGAAVVICTSMLLSNLNILPQSAEAYGVVWAYLVPLAIPLLLLKANLRRLFSETGGMIIAFVMGVIGTTFGAVLGYMLLPLGVEGHKLAGVFSATYIGGSMNMAAVMQSVDLSPSVASASIAVDNVIGVVYLTFLAIIPSIAFFRWWLNAAIPAKGGYQEDISEEPQEKHVSLNLQHLGVALALAFCLCALGTSFAELLGVGGYSILFITALTLAVANFFPQLTQKVQGDYEIGIFFMYLFFAAIGATADLSAMFKNAAVIGAYASLIIVCHGLVIFGVSRFFNLKLFDVIVASNACVIGPASAAALAAGKGRSDLVTPAILLGVMGYAVANFIGVGLSLILAS